MRNPINELYIIGLIRLYIGRLIKHNRKHWLKGQSPLDRKSYLTGQVWLEYTLIIVLIIAALVGMQLYLQRGLQGRYKDAADYALRMIAAARGIYTGQVVQYEPYYKESEIVTESDSQIRRFYLPGGESGTVIDRDRSLDTGTRREPPYSDGME